MVEINNQRKAFLDMLAWSEGTDNGRPETEIAGYDVIVGRVFTDYSDHPAKLVTPNPETQINRRRTLPASFPLVGCLPQAAWPERLLSKKSGRCGIAGRLGSIGALPMIDRGDIRQAIDRCSNIWASPSCPSWLWSVRA